MSSPGQKRGACGHAMASFDGHLSCARCRDKGKGKDTCVENKDSTNCSHCNALTPEQKAQLATPSYKLKKEKREAKKAETETPMESNTLVDPSSVSVLGVVDNAGVVSPSVPPEKKVKKDKDKVVVKTKKSTSSAESKIADLDLKWSERFNRLEALLLSKSLQPSFSADVRVSPSHTPPANISKDSEPFFQPSVSSVQHSNVERTGPDNTDASQHQSAGKLQNTPPAQRTGPDIQLATKQQSAGKLSDKPSRVHHSSKRTGPDNKDASQQQSAGKLPVQTSGRTGPDKMSSKQGFTGKSLSERPVSDRPSDRPVDRLQSSSSPDLHRSSRQDSISSQESASDSDLSDRPPIELFVEDAELSDNQEVEPDQNVSEDQTYRETMRGIRAYMGWSHVPDIDSSNPSDDNPFAGPKTPAPSKISVQMPTEDWLCRKLAKLNMTLVEGYPSRTSEAGGLLVDQFLRPAKSQVRWYGICPAQKCDPPAVSSWNVGASKINSSYSRIARKAGMAATPPASRRISQDTLRRWEQTAREATVVCNQTASFNRCMFKVQEDMHSQLKSIRMESKGKGSTKASEALDELQHLIEFNSSITQSAARAMEHLTDFVFVTMGNLTLVRRDSYLSHVKNGIKHDTLAALRTGPLQFSTIFPDSVIKKAEEEIAYYDSKGQSANIPKGKGRYHPYERVDRKSEGRQEAKVDRQAWKNIGKRQNKRGRGRNFNFSSRPAKGQQSYK